MANILDTILNNPNLLKQAASQGGSLYGSAGTTTGNQTVLLPNTLPQINSQTSISKVAQTTPSGQQNPPPATPPVAQTQPDYTALINQILTSHKQDPFSLTNQSTDQLNGLLQTIQKSISNQPNYTDILNQARQSAGIPDLQNQLAQIQGQYNTLNTAYNNTATNLQQQPMLLPQLTGHEAILEQQRQNALGNLVGQQNVLNTQLGLGQQYVGQALGAAQTQQQTGLQQAGLGMQLAGLPSQVALQQAQAQQAQAQAGFYQNLYGGLTNAPQGSTTQGTGQGGILPQFQSAPNGQELSQLPQLIQGAVSQDVNGTGFIVASRIPDLGGNGLALAQSYAGKLGIPILNASQAQGAEKIDSSIGAINILKNLSTQVLSSGTTGRLGDIMKSKLNDIFQNSPMLTQLNRARTTAIQEIQGLAGDAPGLRLNAGEINTAASNLPTANDNLETALAKIQMSITMLENQRGALYNYAGYRPQVSTQASGQNQGGSVGWIQ